MLLLKNQKGDILEWHEVRWRRLKCRTVSTTFFQVSARIGPLPKEIRI